MTSIPDPDSLEQQIGEASTIAELWTITLPIDHPRRATLLRQRERRAEDLSPSTIDVIGRVYDDPDEQGAAEEMIGANEMPTEDEMQAAWNREERRLVDEAAIEGEVLDD